MTKNKRFECNKGSRIIIDNETKLHYIMTLDWECSLVTKLLNRFVDENEELKEKLKIYHKIANCKNCNYHDYDWFDDGSYDEFEVCRKGNDVTEGICEEWREL